jgi:hypothetical protein
MMSKEAVEVNVKHYPNIYLYRLGKYHGRDQLSRCFNLCVRLHGHLT